jgi:phosphoglycolate phosphatase-like HAD superfamily hydrolase
MQPIEGILFEPVGCLAEFPAQPFLEIASRVFQRRKKPSESASRSYWHLLNLMEAAGPEYDSRGRQTIETLEALAVDGATLYEDVKPSLAELEAMGLKLIIASSLGSGAVQLFLEKFRLSGFFASVWGRDQSKGVKSAPLSSAVTSSRRERMMFLADTAEGLNVAKSVGVIAVLMMNDPDEARRLALRQPAGGIVSLHELPDFVRLVAARNARLATG